MTLAEFVTARLDEDERNARQALAQWPDAHFTIDPGSLVIVGFHRRHDPARVLREVAAGRKILAQWRDLYPVADSLMQEQQHGVYAGDGEHTLGAYAALSEAVRALAAINSDHPDYDPAWAPA